LRVAFDLKQERVFMPFDEYNGERERAVLRQGLVGIKSGRVPVLG